MKTLLKISLICNVVFLGAATIAGFKVSHYLKLGAAAPVVTANVVAQSGEAPRPTEPVPLRPEPAPFRWSQLESKDYHDYVKNLRAIRCPEPTVRAIVVADVRAAFESRVRALEQKLADLNNGSWQTQLSHYKDEAELKAELERLPDEEAAEVADMLGLAPSRTTTEVARDNRPVRQAQPISAPLVFQLADVSTLHLSDEEEQTVENIRQSFLEDIGGTNQDPADPAYQARWQKAQPAADSQLKAMLGVNGYLKYQNLAYQKSLEPQPVSEQSQ